MLRLTGGFRATILAGDEGVAGFETGVCGLRKCLLSGDPVIDCDEANDLSTSSKPSGEGGLSSSVVERRRLPPRVATSSTKSARKD